MSSHRLAKDVLGMSWTSCMMKVLEEMHRMADHISAYGDPDHAAEMKAHSEKLLKTPKIMFKKALRR